MRRTGKTTRLIDEAIQTLFNDGIICVPKAPIYSEKINHKRVKVFIDPNHSNMNHAQDYFRARLRRRLEIEHEGCFVITGDNVKIIPSLKP